MDEQQKEHPYPTPDPYIHVEKFFGFLHKK
jgi:hypothetical protein